MCACKKVGVVTGSRSGRAMCKKFTHKSFHLSSSSFSLVFFEHFTKKDKSAQFYNLVDVQGQKITTSLLLKLTLRLSANTFAACVTLIIIVVRSSPQKSISSAVYGQKVKIETSLR